MMGSESTREPKQGSVEGLSWNEGALSAQLIVHAPLGKGMA